MMDIKISLVDDIEEKEVVDLYHANEWSSAEKPDQLMKALRGSHSLVTARYQGVLVGLGNAISDGHLVVYFPHLLVHPKYWRNGIGSLIMRELLVKYRHFHQLMITADQKAFRFYEKLGFERAGQTIPMWIYCGHEH